MKGFMRQRGASWELRVFLGPDPLAGKKRYATRTVRSPGTVKRIHGILRRALNQGVKWGWIGINPATATTPPRVLPSDIKPPSPEALGRVLRRAEVDSPDLACYLMLAAATRRPSVRVDRSSMDRR